MLYVIILRLVDKIDKKNGHFKKYMLMIVKIKFHH